MGYIRWVFALFLLISVSCQSADEPVVTGPTDGEVQDADTPSVFHYRPVMQLPSPLEVVNVLKASGAAYSPAYLLNPEVFSLKESADLKALHFGALNVAMIYHLQNRNAQQALHLMGFVKAAAEELSSGGAYGNAFVQRFNENMGRPDSLLAISAGAFSHSVVELEKTSRLSSALAYAGALTEALHLAVLTLQKTQETPSVELQDWLLNQREPIAELISLLASHGGVRMQKYRVLLTNVEQTLAAISSRSGFKESVSRLTVGELSQVAEDVVPLRKYLMRP